jgi:hypothetical protein
MGTLLYPPLQIEIPGKSKPARAISKMRRNSFSAVDERSTSPPIVRRNSGDIALPPLLKSSTAAASTSLKTSVQTCLMQAQCELNDAISKKNYTRVKVIAQIVIKLSEVAQGMTSL